MCVCVCGGGSKLPLPLMLTSARAFRYDDVIAFFRVISILIQAVPKAPTTNVTFVTNEKPMLNDKTMFQNYMVGVDGACEIYDPPLSYATTLPSLSLSLSLARALSPPPPLSPPIHFVLFGQLESVASYLYRFMLMCA